MNNFSVKALDRQTLEALDTDQIIAFTYAEKDARRFSGMIDIAVFDGENFTFYFDNYLDSELSIKDYSKLLLPLMRSTRLESHFRSIQKDYAEERVTSFDGINFSLGAFSRTWMHYMIGDHRHLFINRSQEVYIEELAAAVSENIAQSNVVPTIKTQLTYIDKYWSKAIADIFEIEDDRYSKPNKAELSHLTPAKLQFIYCNINDIRAINESNKTYRAYELTTDQLSNEVQQLLNSTTAIDQSNLVGASGIELDYFFHSEYFHFIDINWIHISLGEGSYMLIRREFFDQAMRLCSYYRRQNLYDMIVDGKGMRDNTLRYLFDYYWRICALRLAQGGLPFTKPYSEHLDMLPLTQHAYNLLQLESTMNKKINMRKIADFANIVNTYIDDIPNDNNAKLAYLRRDKILAATFLSQLSSKTHKYEELAEVYGIDVANLVQTIRKFKREKPESLSLTESLVLTARIVRDLNEEFSSCDVVDIYRKGILKSFFEQISFIISDREKLTYTEEGEFSKRNALWFSQLQILQMRLDYLLDN